MERLIKELDKNLVLTEVENIDINCSVLLHIEYDKSYISCCPECGQPAARKNGAHKRTVKDLPLMGRKVIFVIKVRELFCDNSCCPRKTFSERFHFLGETGFRTQRLDDYAVRSFLESSAIATERLFSDKVADISNDTILRLVKKKPQISSNVQIAAIDDFALKKRHNYGTVLIDAKNHRIVDMLESREKEDVTEWLRSYQDIEIFTRDGSSSYAVSISDSHPNALQIMDRFHILFHLTDYGKNFINRTVKASEPIEDEEFKQEDIPHFETTYDKIMAAKALKIQGESITSISEQLFISEMTVRKYIKMKEEDAEKFNSETRLQRSEKSANAKEQLFKEIHLLHGQGLTQVAISRKLNVARSTVSDYLKLSEPPRRAYNSQRRREKIEPFIPRITELGEQGYKNKEIVRILKTEGCTCGDSYIGKIITEQRKLRFAAPKKKVPRKALISLLYRSLDKVSDLSEDDLQKMIERYPMLEMLYDLTRRFKEILFSKKAELLEVWLDAAETGGISELKSFANGIRQDLEATKAGIKYSYSNGIAEGNVNKIKMIKRRMYGRCSFELLRAAVLLNQNG